MQTPISNNQVINSNDLPNQTADSTQLFNNAALLGATPSQTLNPLQALKLRFSTIAITNEDLPSDHGQDGDERTYEDPSTNIYDTMTSVLETQSPVDNDDDDVLVKPDVAELKPISQVLAPDSVATNVSLIQSQDLNAIEITPQRQSDNFNSATAKTETESKVDNIWKKAVNAILPFNNKGGSIFNRAGKIRRTENVQSNRDRELRLSNLRSS